MPIQAITRQALLNKITEIVKNLPDDQLQQTWDQVNSWDPAVLKRAPVDDKDSRKSVDDQETTEFVVSSQQAPPEHFVRLPVRSKRMGFNAIMEVAETPFHTHLFTQRLQANIAWWNQNCEKIRNDATLFDRYVAISNGIVFSADSYLDAYNQACKIDTDGVPYIFFLKSPNHSSNHEN